MSGAPYQAASGRPAPERGSLWRHPYYGGAWRVESVGPVWVTLKRPTPLAGYPNTAKVLRAFWPTNGHETWTNA